MRLSAVQGFEQIKSIYLDSQQFSVENELMTPTFKVGAASCAVRQYDAQILLSFTLSQYLSGCICPSHSHCLLLCSSRGPSCRRHTRGR